ncbi:transmembrane protein 98-like isoform X2 [Planococcus citri]|uniref:transmembrane protein 98-like isoform X2 n=1 Tax=Planococcus citri TaxID=170843 RepID=UPI0031F9F6AA
MEAVVIAAFAILIVVLMSSTVLLVFLCCQKSVRKSTTKYMKSLGSNSRFIRPKNVQLISESSEVELGEVCLHPDIEQILSDEQWINDASGLMPHCLAILKLCHLLTNRIIALTMANISQHRKNNLESFVQLAKKITPRADDVVRSMYAPLDARLLEARTVALVLSVTHLALAIKYSSSCSRDTQELIDKALFDMDKHLEVLRAASSSYESLLRAQTSVPQGHLNETFVYD